MVREGCDASMGQLMTMAAAMERRMASLYATLIAALERSGENGDAAALLRSLGDLVLARAHEAEHLAASPALAPAEIPAEGAATVWSRLALPAGEMAAADEMPPFRAFALALAAEERAFALYSYAAACADTRGGEAATAAARAETWARHALERATWLRVKRRRAFQRERAGTPLPTVAAPTDLDGFDALAGRHEAETGAVLLDLARAMARTGADAASRTLIAGLATGRGGGPASEPGPITAPGTTRAALKAALDALIDLNATYEAIAEAASDQTVMAAALAGGETALSEISLVRERLLALPAAG